MAKKKLTPAEIVVQYFEACESGAARFKNCKTASEAWSKAGFKSRAFILYDFADTELAKIAKKGPEFFRVDPCGLCPNAHVSVKRNITKMPFTLFKPFILKKYPSLKGMI
jgi:hypothetical protein